MKILFTIILFTTLSACSQNQEKKKHIPDPNAKLLNDSAINLAMQSPPKNFEKAISLLDQATQIDSNYSAAYNSKLSFELSLQRFNNALATIKSLTRINPNTFTYYFFTGVLMNKTGDSINAQKYFAESLKHIDSVLNNMDRSNRRYDDGMMNKGIILIFLGQQREGNDILKNLYDKQKDPIQKEMYGQFLNKSPQEIMENIFSSDTAFSKAEPAIKN